MIKPEQVSEFWNLNLTDILTPVKVDRFVDLLQKSNFDADKIEYLRNGFSEGFSLEFEGKLSGARTSANLKLTVGSKLDLWNKIMDEVKDGRFAGPFAEPPFTDFIQSPIGLVPKDGGKKTRLIFHLSHPRSGVYQSVNAGIPRDKCTVVYPDFEQAIKLCLKAGIGCNISKSDISRAFRNCPIRRKDWALLIMKAEHPITGVTYYFVDKCLPFGSSISCAIFQKVSDAIAHVVTFITKEPNVNYLDDFLFAALLKAVCDEHVQVFLDTCEDIGFPVAIEKTCWGTTWLVFLGLLIDTERQLICILIDKVIKAENMICYFLNKRNSKATVLEFQKLCGYLNFLCRCVLPGRTFVRRLYLSGNKLKPHHHVRISREHRADLNVWLKFIRHPHIFSRGFMDTEELNSELIDMYSDASRNFSLGFGAYCGTEWSFGKWDRDFMIKHEPSIEYLELYAVAVAVLNWIRIFANRKICLFCDNMAVVHMINNMSSKCEHCMVLIRLIVLEGLVWNVKIRAKFVGTKSNGKADALSRLDLKRFRRLDSAMNVLPLPIHDDLYPMTKVWSY